MRQQVQIQQQFDALFWKGRPVVIVTQYKSAGIGINLHYLASHQTTKIVRTLHGSACWKRPTIILAIHLTKI